MSKKQRNRINIENRDHHDHHDHGDGRDRVSTASIPLSDGNNGNSDVIQTTAKPTKYDAKIARRVLDRIADGELLVDIEKDPDMPTRRTFRYWLESRDELSAPYARARLFWADSQAETIMGLVSDPKGNFIDQHGNKLPLSHEEVGALRLRVDAIKWLTGKWAPRTYGEKPADDMPKDDRIVKIVRTIVDPGPRPAVAVPAEPLQLTYERKLPAPDGPLPATVQERLRGILERCVPSDRHANAYALWDEVAGVIEIALSKHYGTEG
jgi:hypothetical protein